MSIPDNPKLFKVLHMIPNPDGTFTRLPGRFSSVPPSTTDPTSPSLSKDVPLNSKKNTWARLFLPREFISNGELPSVPARKLPLLIYIHGGGFVVAGPDQCDHPPFHEFCSVAARQLGALVMSVKYRLAPEHRLPAAYDDVWEALSWVKDCKEEWIREHGDLSKCVLMGESAGGNITYHVGLKAAVKSDELKPLVIKGFVLIQPFFSGLDRTESEIRLDNDPILKLELNDFCWVLSLPLGTSRDHEYSDPIKDGGSRLVDRVRELGMWVAVVGCDGDPLIDRNVELAKLLEKKGVNVRTMFTKGGQHGMFVGGDATKRVEFLDFVKDFWP